MKVGIKVVKCSARGGISGNASKLRIQTMHLGVKKKHCTCISVHMLLYNTKPYLLGPLLPKYFPVIKL